MFGGDKIFGPHSDVLSAQPVDDEDKRRLVAELKNRAKSSIKSKNWPEAISLYKKGIEVSPRHDTEELSILNANISMCQLSMEKADDALMSADAALGFNKQYIKAYYRKAMALIKLRKLQAAKQALLDGLELKADDVELNSQLLKVDKDILEQGVEKLDEKVPIVTASASRSSSAAAMKSSPSASVGESVGEVVADDEDAGIVRGYKKTSDGRTTSYFNHELDDQTRKLIGDIRPKRLEVLEEKKPDGLAPGSSVWNSAGTFESVSHTPYAVQRITELLSSEDMFHTDSASGSSIRVKSLKDIVGDAEITMLRGKRKHIYDFQLTIRWELSSASGRSVEGDLVVADVTADQDYDFASVTVDGEVPADLSSLVASQAKGDKGMLRKKIIAALNTFDKEFKLK